MATIRRLYKQGNSTVLSVPGWMLEYNGLEVGDEVMMESAERRGRIQFQKWNPPAKAPELEVGEAGRKSLRG